MDSNLYLYKAKIISVYDGDTCRVDIDLGLKVWIKNEKLRLLRIDAPELIPDFNTSFFALVMSTRSGRKASITDVMISPA